MPTDGGDPPQLSRRPRPLPAAVTTSTTVVTTVATIPAVFAAARVPAPPSTAAHRLT